MRSASPALSRPRVPRATSLNVFANARSNPTTWVPPFGVAITLTKDRSSVS